MSQEEIEISIDRQGRVVVRTSGIKGPRCVGVAEAVAQIVGREESRQLTSEFYEGSQDIRTHAVAKHQS